MIKEPSGEIEWKSESAGASRVEEIEVVWLSGILNRDLDRDSGLGFFFGS